MVIDRAIVSTDDNSLYYEFWPYVAKGWKNINIEPTVAVIGDVNLNYAYGSIIKVPVMEGIPSGFIAQVIRFIIPCLYPHEVSVIGDIDMIPLRKDYFSKEIAQYDNDAVIVFSSDAYKGNMRYPMCYIAAKGKYFQQIIGLKGTDLLTVQEFIKDLYALNLNWDTDELFFARKLNESDLLKNTILLERGWGSFAKNRIDRVNWKYSKIGFFLNKYIDAHCMRPLHDHGAELKDVIDYVELGSDGKRYRAYLQKKPFRKIRYYLLTLQQSLVPDGLFTITKKLGTDSSKTRIIAFSLYGSDPRYVANLDKVLDSYQEFLPDWKHRVYVAADISLATLKRLTDKGCEVFIMQQTGIDARYSCWRFLAIEDSNAEAVIIRDLDSVATAREKLMVEQWIDSDKKFHIIRDHMNHNTRIMAGMWGVKQNNLDIKKERRKFLLTNNYGTDQVFLERIIYPLIKHDVMIHDSFPRFPDEAAIVIPLSAGESHIGEIATDEISRQRDHQYQELFNTKCFTLK